MRNRELINFIQSQPWAIRESALNTIIRAVDVQAEGALTPWSAGGSLPRESGGSIMILPVHGIITQRTSLFSAIFGGTSTEALGREIQRASTDPNIKAIVLDVDSPGGTVGGVTELSEIISQARVRKNIIAVVNSLAASAAYWLASSSSEIVITPSGETGSIGVFMLHTDFSAMDKRLGIKRTLISAGEHKVEGNPFEPLGDEAKRAIQKDVDFFHSMFIKDVARGRGISSSTVRNDFGRGRILNAQAAKRAGLVDKIATLDETLSRLVSGRSLGRARGFGAANNGPNRFDIARAKLELACL